MVNKRDWMGILVIVLIFGMTVVSCDNGSTKENSTSTGSGSGGVFILTGIPSKYNGMYVYVEIDLVEIDNTIIGGYDPSTDEITGGPISNGRAEVPLWVEGDDLQLVERYKGNHTVHYVEITIHEEKNSEGEIAELDYSGSSGSLKFTNGSATMNWNAFEVSE